MALTKSVALVDACQEIAQNTMLEGAVVDVSGCYAAALHIDFAQTNATAHTGTKIRVQVSSNTPGGGDEDWHDLAEFTPAYGTTNLEAITNNPLAVGGTSITVASTTGYTPGMWVFLEDATFGNSEWVFVTVVTTNVSLTIVDGVTREHANTAVLNSIASRLPPIDIPDWAQRVRVVYDNTYDSDGATVAVRCRISKLTGV